MNAIQMRRFRTTTNELESFVSPGSSQELPCSHSGVWSAGADGDCIPAIYPGSLTDDALASAIATVIRARPDIIRRAERYAALRDKIGVMSPRSHHAEAAGSARPPAHGPAAVNS